MFLYFRWSRIYRGQCKKRKKSSRGMASAFKSRQHRWLTLWKNITDVAQIRKDKFFVKLSKKNFSWNCHHHRNFFTKNLKINFSVLLYTRIGCVILMMCNISFTVITPHTQLSCLFMLFSRVFLKLVRFNYLFFCLHIFIPNYVTSSNYKA